MMAKSLQRDSSSLSTSGFFTSVGRDVGFHFCLWMAAILRAAFFYLSGAQRMVKQLCAVQRRPSSVGVNLARQLSFQPVAVGINVAVSP
jgi:hypothetical protein